MPAQTPGEVFPDWFAKHVALRPDGCWEWTGGRYANGYPRVWNRDTRAQTGAHRCAYTLTRGPIPSGTVVDHICGLILCVRPDHLDTTTSGENVRRGYAVRGQRPTVREQNANQSPHVPISQDRPSRKASAPSAQSASVRRMARVTDPDDPLKQFNVRIPESMHAAIEQRRLGLGISRDEWARRALAHVLDSTRTGPDTLSTPAGRSARTPRRTP